MKKLDEDLPSDSLIGHLHELKKRLTYALSFILAGSVLSWIYSEKLFDIIRAPIAPYLKTQTGGLVYTGVMDKFMAHMKIAMLGGVVLTCPFWIYHLWKFIEPGLYNKEKKVGIIFILSGTFLFLTGVTFVYYLVYPMAFNFLMTFGGEQDVAMITIGEYIGFFMTTTVLFGVVFELPLILTILGMLGIVEESFLREKRGIAVVILAIVSAVITPPDLVSMIVLLIPLTLLYEMSIYLVRAFGQKSEGSS